MQWTELVELLLRRRAAALREDRITDAASAHDWRRARAAAEAAILHSVRRHDHVVLVADVVRQAEEQFRLRLSGSMASCALKEQLTAYRGLMTDTADY
ncbi:hypothetical protein OG568_61010 (plasmid) [Streptomyces sp. NBC_01450]|uniref:hypothetical protein n=1 Tax=Streptomyces sp. NBC_01450 TaxID=2903871 RepID=UPI002E2F3E6F|nr:hypothetical protein [Streptomyces sp. NBC_01450]